MKTNLEGYFRHFIKYVKKINCNCKQQLHSVSYWINNGMQKDVRSYKDKSLLENILIAALSGEIPSPKPVVVYLDMTPKPEPSSCSGGA